MPIDATGYTLHGKNLTGGNIQFADQGTLIASFLAHEAGKFELPLPTDLNNKPLKKADLTPFKLTCSFLHHNHYPVS